jgi:hypothetical protein
MLAPFAGLERKYNDEASVPEKREELRPVA